MSPIAIPRARTLQDLHASVRAHRPCIWKPEHSYAFQSWTLDQLADHYGDHRVTTRASPNRSYIDVSAPFREQVRSLRSRSDTLRSYLAEGLERGHLLSGTDTYLFTQGAPRAPWEDLWAQCTACRDDLFSDYSVQTVGMWMSGSGIRTMTHYDSSGDHNLNFQILGRKRFLLFPPSDWPHLETVLALSLHPHDVFDAIREGRSPLPVSPMLGEITAGEVLFIPSQHYHSVEHVGAANLNLSWWFAHGKPAIKPGRSTRNLARITQLAGAVIAARCADILGLP